MTVRKYIPFLDLWVEPVLYALVLLQVIFWVFDASDDRVWFGCENVFRWYHYI